LDLQEGIEIELNCFNSKLLGFAAGCLAAIRHGHRPRPLRCSPLVALAAWQMAHSAGANDAIFTHLTPVETPITDLPFQLN